MDHVSTPQKKYSNIDNLLVTKDLPKINGIRAPIFGQMSLFFSFFFYLFFANTPRVHRVIVHSQECRPDGFLTLE